MSILERFKEVVFEKLLYRLQLKNEFLQIF